MIIEIRKLERKGTKHMDYKHKLETPCFVIDSNIINGLVSDLKTAVHKYFTQSIIGYSFKTNNTPFVIKHMKEMGLYAEVVSSSEYELAKEMGFEVNKIIFNGPVKGKEQFIEAVENNAVVNIDSKRELKWLLECHTEKLNKAKVGLRVNFCLEDYCPGESQTGKEDGRFGFSYETGELKEAIDFFIEHKIPLSGLHLHCSSKTRSLNIYKAISSIAARIIEEYKLNLSYLDIGGGFFGGMIGKPTFDDYCQVVNNIFKDKIYYPQLEIIIEPGMSIIGPGMSYVSKVVDIKETKNNMFIILDGSRIHIDPLMRKSSYTYQIDRKCNEDDEIKHQILCGFTCMEGDRFFSINDKLLNVNDYIIFNKVGAYTIGLSPQFIEFHPNIYMLSEKNLILVQRKKNAKDFIIE